MTTTAQRPLTIADVLEVMAESIPDRDAVITKDRTYTYAEIDERANRLANHLLSLGVGKGDHVAVHARNRIEWVDAFFACPKIGAVAINVTLCALRPRLRRLHRKAPMMLLGVLLLLVLAGPLRLELGECLVEGRGILHAHAVQGVERLGHRLEEGVEFVAEFVVVLEAALRHTFNGRADRGVCRVDPALMQQPQRGQGRHPGLPVRVTHDRFGPPVAAREAGAASPLSVGLQVKEPPAPAGLRHLSALGPHLILARAGEVRQHLPADRWVARQ